jgi:predicted glycoside hydrolase/deacetylase ChbG (UPF0249 family)
MIVQPTDKRFHSRGFEGSAGGRRCLLVTADDYGIGPATSQGIIDLAVAGRLSCSVLLVTSPYAEQAVQAWREAEQPFELGWHPCLTLDRPIAAPKHVPSLVDANGVFWPLGDFLRRLFLGQLRSSEIDIELKAQYQRFRDLVGYAPRVVNSHHHVQIFAPVGAILRQTLGQERPLPYLRRIREPWRTLTRVPGARLKRAFLSTLGWREARRQAEAGFPGNDSLAGVTDPHYVADPAFLARWLAQVPGHAVELTCHPGYRDPTLIDRDCKEGDPQLERRPREFDLLQHPSFLEARHRAGFKLVKLAELLAHPGTACRAA